MATIPTMRVHRRSDPDGDPIVINWFDFDPEKHVEAPDARAAEIAQLFDLTRSADGHLSKRLDAQQVALMFIVRALHPLIRREQISGIRKSIPSLEGDTLGDNRFQQALDEILGQLEKALPEGNEP